MNESIVHMATDGGSVAYLNQSNARACCRYRILLPVKTDNMLWWASVLMFIGATGFNISNIAGVVYADYPSLSPSQSHIVSSAVNLERCMPLFTPFRIT